MSKKNQEIQDETTGGVPIPSLYWPARDQTAGRVKQQELGPRVDLQIGLTRRFNKVFFQIMVTLLVIHHLAVGALLFTV